MRKLQTTLSFILLAAALCGCYPQSAATDEGVGSQNKIRVISTVFPPYDFTRQIAGDKAEITMLVPPGSESHFFEPTPQDIIKIQGCDVFIYVGGYSDGWVKRILDSIDTDKVSVITLMDCVDVVEEETVEGMDSQESDHLGPEYDEHVWTSPKNAKLIVQKISGALCEADAANADIYKSNTASYLKKLDELDAAFQKTVDNGVRRTVVFGDRFPFRYLTDAYGLTYYAAFPGCAAETEPSAQTISFLIGKVKNEKIPTVFYLEQSNEKMADIISEETGANKLLLHSCHNVSKNDFENGATYLGLMTRNVDALREALS